MVTPLLLYCTALPWELFAMIQQLMRLKDTHPQEFDKYVQMAEDATKLASERPEMFEAIMRDKISDSYLGGEQEKAWYWC